MESEACKTFLYFGACNWDSRVLALKGPSAPFKIWLPGSSRAVEIPFRQMFSRILQLCAIWELSREHGKFLPSRTLQSSRRIELKAQRWTGDAKRTLESQEAGTDLNILIS